MSFKVSNNLQFPQPTLQYNLQGDSDVNSTRGLPLLGGILSDTRYVWHAKGPHLEVRNNKSGIKVGAWTFGCILKDSNTRIVCVEEIQRLNGMLPLLAVGLECAISGGLICIFDVFGSKVIRAIQIKEKITSLHVVDSGCEVLNLPGPLRDFDGIISVGTEGGNVFLVDICRQICEEALHSMTIRDELCPCHLVLLTLKDVPRIEYYKERSVRDGDHLAIHLNVVLNSSTHHFTLKGPKGDDRIFVNKEEVVTSALYYCSQLTSLLVGFNFGAFQLWDLTNLNLVYTSAVCEEHLPITKFALQEPADDPRAFCYIWVCYSNTELFQSGLPFAVMYSLCYESKEYHEGYGYLYLDFQTCSIRFQVELGPLEEHKTSLKVKGGMCIALQPICKVPNNRDLYLHDVTGDNIALCNISWSVWYSQSDVQTYTLVFDLNQWYKEQMPDFTKWSDCSNYILKANISDIIMIGGRKSGPLLNLRIDSKSIRQFMGVQRLEEHFCPSALSFDLWVLRENNVITLHNEGLQKALFNHIESAGPLCLLRPNDVYRQIISLGLTPLFTEATLHTPISTDSQREVILNVALEHQLVAWLCKCASEWANGSFSSAGCSLDFLINWAFQRAVLLKTHCDNFCIPLFDYSQLRLDNNTSTLLNCCIRQINDLSVLYSHILNKLSEFISNLELVSEQHTSLKLVSIYFEVLQWLVNVGLLPECHPSTYPKIDNPDRVSAPYPVQKLTEYYNKKRAQLQMLTNETFISSDSLLFIDNLVNNECGAQLLQKQWQDDGGSGLYPPPSLQSLLRTYLIEGADISNRHSLIIYLFLDLAMALDQGKYASVITHLIKFPAVFKVRSSIIKITQAFWQLDHGDFTTAMEQLLDPFVLSDDLQQWHHAIAMRSLLLQNQYNFALLYMQVRKPPITDEKDVLTAISLFIANNMLDEAFYFKTQHRNNNEEKLLLHLFKECNKNDSLHVLLYRCLDTYEEKAFFKYLKSVENPTCDDLQVFYYLLRSRFVEAFDTHQNSKRKKPECQGLIGQRNATKTDQIVRIFKTLLPDINRNLVDVIRKERTNLWKEVARPTPLSVFVHNTNEQVHYKSTVIQAALAKAKHTFIDSPYTNKSRDIVTEETPFLRTPVVSRISSRHLTPVITPKVIELNESGEELGPSPSKRLKLTPRASTSSPTKLQNLSVHSKMLTPIIKRKTSQQKDDTILSDNSFNVCTPQSILKVRNLVKHSDSISDDTKIDEILEDYEGLPRTETSPRKTSLGLLPRKSLSRSRPHVKFDDAVRLSSSFSDQSIKPSLNNTSLENLSANKSTLSSKDISLIISSKNSSSNTDDVFYSPNSSINNSSNKEEDNSKQSISQTVDTEIVEVHKSLDVSEDINNSTKSPRARRSYKRSFGETTPVRYSPRINRHPTKEHLELDVTNDNTVVSNNEDELSNVIQEDSSNLSETTTTIKQSPRLLQKVRGRKSLSRQVLEHNTFSKILSSPSVLDSSKLVSREMSFSKTERSIVTEKTRDTLEVTTNETSEEITNISALSNTSVSSQRQSMNSVYKEKVSDEDSDEDSEMSFNYSLNSPQLPDRLKMSDSLVEYWKSRTSKADQERRSTNNITTQPEAPQTEDNMEEDLQDDTRKNESRLNESQHKTESMEVYEDLSSGSEDIQEVLMGSKRQSDPSKVDAELSNSSENTFNVLEKNIFERTMTHPENTPVKSTNSDSFYHRTSDSFHVPDSEKGFLEDYSKTEISSLSVESDLPEAEKGFIGSDESGKEPEVIQIDSSSDDQEDKDNSSETSRSSEKSEEIELNISYERNIHVEEETKVLVDSEDSRTTGDSVANEDNHTEELYINNQVEVTVDNFADSANIGQQSTYVIDEEMPLQEGGQVEETGQAENVQDKLYQTVEDRTIVNQESSVEKSEDIVDEQVEGNQNQEVINISSGNVSEIEGDFKKTDDVLESEKESSKQIGDKVVQQVHCFEKEHESINTTQETLPKEKSTIDESTNIKVIITSCAEENVSNATEGSNTTQETPPKVKSTIDQSTKTTIIITSSVEENVSDATEVSNTTQETLPKEKRTIDQSTNTTIIITSCVEENVSNATEVSNTTQETLPKEKSTIDQSTNTTIIITSCAEENVSDTAEVSKELNKVNQSTNATVVESHQIVKQTDDSHIEIDRPKERKMYHPKHSTMKVTAEDQTMSSMSSEDDGMKRDSVVKALVHTPTKKRTEEPLIRRITRRSSALFSQTTESETLGNMTEPETSFEVSDCDIMDEYLDTTCATRGKIAYVPDILEDSAFAKTFDANTTPGARTRRSRSLTASPSRLSMSLRHSHKDPAELSQLDTPKETKRDTPSRLKKTRSLSVDEVVASPKRRSLRHASVEDKCEETESDKQKSRGRAASVNQLPIITEEEKGKGKTVGRGKTSSLVDYTTARRLTRRQASLVKGIETPSAQDDSDVEKELDADVFDPIKLLDKEPFQGPPDPEEEKVYEPSSPSNSTASSFSKPTKRAGRSASVASDSSAPPNTPKKRTRQQAAHVDSPTPTGIKTRSRRISETSSITSEKSDPPTPPKLRRRSSSKDGDEASSVASSLITTRSTRSRANSVSSVKSETKSPKKQPRSRRLVSTKSELPEITEEKTNEPGDPKEKSKRHSKRKTSS